LKKKAAEPIATQSGSLLEGEYDEQEQENQFKNAVLAWRTGGKPQHEEQPDEVLGEPKKKGVTFAGEKEGTEKKGAFSFFAGLGGNDFDFDVMP